MDFKSSYSIHFEFQGTSMQMIQNKLSKQSLFWVLDFSSFAFLHPARSAHLTQIFAIQPNSKINETVHRQSDAKLPNEQMKVSSKATELYSVVGRNQISMFACTFRCRTRSSRSHGCEEIITLAPRYTVAGRPGSIVSLLSALYEQLIGKIFARGAQICDGDA